MIFHVPTSSNIAAYAMDMLMCQIALVHTDGTEKEIFFPPLRIVLERLIREFSIHNMDFQLEACSLSTPRFGSRRAATIAESA